MAFRTSATSSLPSLPVVFSADAAVAGGPMIRRHDSFWRRFSWSLSSVLPIDTSSQNGDLIRLARREEGEDVLQTVLLSLAMDSSWNDSYAMAEHYLTSTVGRLFNESEPLCLVIQKGNRLIAASLLDPDLDAVHQLVSGPMVTTEYRNRGIGTRLLHASLAALQERGLTRATGITRDRTVAARHVYAKFGSVSESFGFPSLLEGRREAKA
ncbi:MAG: GNAT family N-acetyltransferase [Verrucomicrobiota bacterium]